MGPAANAKRDPRPGDGVKFVFGRKLRYLADMRDFNLSLIGARRLRALLVSAAVSVSCATAIAKNLDPDLRQQVLASCSADAYRLCPQSLGSEGEAVSCMRKKRHELTDTCRTAYDRVVRTLAQK